MIDDVVVDSCCFSRFVELNTSLVNVRFVDVEFPQGCHHNSLVRKRLRWNKVLGVLSSSDFLSTRGVYGALKGGQKRYGRKYGTLVSDLHELFLNGEVGLKKTVNGDGVVVCWWCLQ